MKTIRKLLLLCLFGMISMGAWATVYEGKMSGSYISWSLDSYTGLLTINGTGYMPEDWYDADDYYDNSFERYSTSIRSVKIEDGIKSITQECFFGCSNLQYITIPSSIEKIGNGAFCGCAKLSSVVLPEGINNIEYNTFYGCSGLTSISLPNSLKEIGGMAFYGCTNLSSIVFPESVEIIGGMILFIYLDQ